jgi:predicted Zn-dependent protease
MKALRATLTLCILLVISACAVNPVTGERQVMFSSFAEDVEIGKQQYQPALQSQGGEYNLDPALTQYVSRVGLKLAALSDVPKLPYEFVVLNNSVPNAWALPSGKIAINRGLLVQLDNEAQLAAVLSHEIVHAAARHGAQRSRDNLFLQVGMMGLGLGLADNDYRSLIIGGASLGAQLTVAKYGRDHELESDEYGMKYMAKAGYDLQGAVDLQKLFLSFSKNKKSSFIDGLFASHPPSQERVDENIQHAKTFVSAGGFIGRAEYQQAIAGLKQAKPAYDLADKASASLSQGLNAEALSLISQAIEIEPKEALFSAIKGDALKQQGNYEAALKADLRATELNPKQFSYFLKRAQSYAALGQSQYAIDDFEYSMRLLPTSIAALGLGELYQQQSQPDQAIKYLTQAASAQGKIGESAQVKLALLEIHKTPEKYLKAKHFQDPKGPLLVKIENHSPLNIASVQLLSQVYDAQGKFLRKSTWQTKELLPAQQASPYYPLKIAYHLKPGEKIKTTVSSLTLE